MQISAHSLYKSYKRVGKNLFKPIDGDSQDVYKYLQMYNRFQSCAQKRILFKEKFIPPESQDAGHEYAISAAKKRAKECETALARIFCWSPEKENTPQFTQITSESEETVTVSNDTLETKRRLSKKQKLRLKKMEQKQQKVDQENFEHSIIFDDLPLIYDIYDSFRQTVRETIEKAQMDVTESEVIEIVLYNWIIMCLFENSVQDTLLVLRCKLSLEKRLKEIRKNTTLDVSEEFCSIYNVIVEQLIKFFPELNDNELVQVGFPYTLCMLKKKAFYEQKNIPHYQQKKKILSTLQSKKRFTSRSLKEMEQSLVSCGWMLDE